MYPSLETPKVHVPLGRWRMDRPLKPGRGLEHLGAVTLGLAGTHGGYGPSSAPE